jgi:ATP-dependent DNA helicase DinG
MYSGLAAVISDFKIKPGQVDLSKAIRRALIDNVPLVAEAPTGIGKTLAYLIGGLAAQQSLKSRGIELPLVIATGTVALQDQIVSNDIPKLVEAGAVGPHDFVVLKGRGRYFCPLNAERFVGDAKAAFQVDMFDTNMGDLDLEDARIEALPMVAEFLDGRWSGEFDSWERGKVSQLARTMTSATAETCLGRTCPHAERCPFRVSRRRAAESPIVVINHDLLLLDLAAARAAALSGEGAEVLPLGQYLLVIDEAHHLPEKSLEHLKSSIVFSKLDGSLSAVAEWVDLAYKFTEVVSRLEEKGLRMDALSIEPVREALIALREASAAQDADESGYRIFIDGSLPETLSAACLDLSMVLQALGQAFGVAAEALKSSKIAERHPRLATVVYGLAAQASAKAAEFNRDGEILMKLASPSADRGCWTQPGVSIEASPIEAATGLTELLWESPRARPVMVSATLRDFGSLAHFRKESGFPANGYEMILPYAFDYSSSHLQIVTLQAPPTYSEIEAWTAELETVLPSHINPAEGTLILFPSRELLTRLRPALDRAHPGGLWQDGSVSASVLKDMHRKRILEEGRGSYLAGLATMAEGMDLPGKLCTHVVIVKLPFSVPNDPLSQLRRARFTEGSYFNQQVLPAVLRKLNQQVGRLLRRETDRGRITIFDSRLVTTGYGRKLLRALPPFSVQVKPAKPHPTR